MGEQLPAPASYYDPKKRPRSWLGEAQTQRVDRAKRTGTTIFGSAWSPDDEGRYLVCTNRGEVVVFDCDTRDHDALFRFSPSTRTLFYVGFIRPSTSSGTRPTTLLTVSGEEGVWVFDWLQLLSSHLGYAANSRPCQPLHRFVTRGEVNALDWDGGSLLFGAGRSELGDTGGACHVWNIETGQSLGALQQAPPLQGQRPPKRRMRQANVPASASHTDYLHCVRCLPGGKLLTGGNDGTMGIWDGKEQKLIEMIDCRAVMDDQMSLVAGMEEQFKGWGSRRLWVSGMDVTDDSSDWAHICGGAEEIPNTSARTSQHTASNGGGGGGYVAIWNLTTRTLTSAHVTRETPQSICCREGNLVTAANEGVVSVWNRFPELKRCGRTWCTPPSAYTLALQNTSLSGRQPLLAVAGIGSTLDVLQDLGNKSFSLNVL